MQQVMNRLHEDLELSYSSRLCLDYLIVLVSHTNILLGRRGEGPCLIRVVVALTLRARLLEFKREVLVKV